MGRRSCRGDEGVHHTTAAHKQQLGCATGGRGRAEVVCAWGGAEMRTLTTHPPFVCDLCVRPTCCRPCTAHAHAGKSSCSSTRTPKGCAGVESPSPHSIAAEGCSVARDSTVCAYSGREGEGGELQRAGSSTFFYHQAGSFDCIRDLGGGGITVWQGSPTGAGRSGYAARCIMTGHGL